MEIRDYKPTKQQEKIIKAIMEGKKLILHTPRYFGKRSFLKYLEVLIEELKSKKPKV